METRTLDVSHSTSTAHRLLNYDGACHNLHGHNLHWEVSLVVDMDAAERGTNMPVDLKEVKGVLDEFDHTLVMNYADALADLLGNYQEDLDLLLLESDPTCERVAGYAADLLLDLDGAVSVEVTLRETDSYAVTETRG